MKNAKKILALLLAFLVVSGTMVTAFADHPVGVEVTEGDLQDITVANVPVDGDGNPYKIEYAHYFSMGNALDCDKDDFVYVPDTFVKPTCTNYGSYYIACVNYISSISDYCACTIEVVLSKLDHEFEEVPTSYRAPTCTSAGIKYFECKNCLASKEEYDAEAPALGHAKTFEFVPDPTIPQVGTIQYTCLRCNKYLGDSVYADISGHDHSNIDLKYDTLRVPTCIDTGYEAQVCLTCSAIIATHPKYADLGPVYVNGREIEALGHEEATITVGETCSDNGSEEVICLRCGETLSKKTIPANGIHTDIQVITKNPTATEPGILSTYCADCGMKIGDDQPIDVVVCKHEASTTSVEFVHPTCTEKGMEGVFCSFCGQYHDVKSVDAKGHTNTKTFKADATCSEPGFERTVCLDCGETLDAKVTAKADHNYEEFVVAEATCTTAQLIKKVCKACGESITVVGDAAKGHGETVKIIENKDIIHGTNGILLYTYTLVCKDCGAVLGDGTVEYTHEHTSDNAVDNAKFIITQPTCTTPGKKGYECIDCGAYFGVEEIQKTGHTESATYSKLIKGTCTREAVREYVCADCGVVVREEELGLAPHYVWKNGSCESTFTTEEKAIYNASTYYQKLVKEATCTSNRVMQTICANCGEVVDEYEVAGTKTEHIAGPWEYVGKTTCYEGCKMQKSCVVCGAVIDEKTEDPHTPEGKWVEVKAATCENAGEKQFICQKCGLIIKTEDVAALGHNWDDDGKAVNNGWSFNKGVDPSKCSHTRTCTRCGITDTAKCSFTTVVVPETCTTIGYTIYTCKTCGGVCNWDFVAAKGHNMSDWAECADGTHERHCTNCNVIDGVSVDCDYAEVEDHDWSCYVFDDNATFCKNGTKTKTCLVCGATSTCEAHHTSFICRVFYPLINWVRNVIDKTQYTISLDWLFPWITRYIEM